MVLPLLLRHSLPRMASSSMRMRSALPRALSTIVFSSPHPNVEIPDQTIWEVVKGQVAHHADRDALICGLSHDRVSFQELHDSTQRLAVALAEDGVKQGDVVLLHSFNCMEYPLVVLALTALGAVCSTASPLFGAKELALQAQVSKARFIITHRSLEDVAIDAAELSGIDRDCLYSMGEDARSRRRLKSINEAAQRHFEPLSFTFESVDPRQTLLLPFSSGTTGLPKGVALSGRNMMANTMQVNHVEPFKDRMLGMLPFFHIYAMLMMHVALYQGVANVILPRFEPETFLSTLERYKIEKANIAPPVALFLAHHPLVDKYDLSATKFLTSGGAPMGKEVEMLVKKRMGADMKQIYGMTEASPAVNYMEDGNRKPGTVGRIVPNTELRVKCTSTDRDLPHNERGELLYRGPQVMQGYLNNPEANQKVLTEDGFLRTGDIGFIDEDGFVHIVDRVKELIKYKGHQVAPAELEDIVNHHPSVSDCCCVRGYDAQGQEVPKMYVVRKQTASGQVQDVSEEQIMDFVSERVAPYKKVRQVEFIDAIPKSATGKMLRRQLQARESNEAASKAHAA